MAARWGSRVRITHRLGKKLKHKYWRRKVAKLVPPQVHGDFKFHELTLNLFLFQQGCRRGCLGFWQALPRKVRGTAVELPSLPDSRGCEVRGAAVAEGTTLAPPHNAAASAAASALPPAPTSSRCSEPIGESASRSRRCSSS